MNDSGTPFEHELYDLVAEHVAALPENAMRVTTMADAFPQRRRPKVVGVLSVDPECPGGTCNSRVGGPPELCNVSKLLDCFDTGTVGETVTVTGNADLPADHQSDPTLAALFCIGPTSSPAVNVAIGLPGLGRLEPTGHMTDNGTP